MKHIAGKHPFKRAERVADLLRRIVSEILLSEIPHHNLEGVNVTEVTVTDDLRHARIFYRVMDPATREQIASELEASRHLIRRAMGGAAKLRYTPEIQFSYDDSLEYGDRIEKLFESLHAKRSTEEE